ncbi:CBM35 domain-containing protein [Paenibacillus andongensis]|uniref:CBM35 domain-containing protein n=1 Tax=Paenibacillus andongensis TaxID=2975482 RepID=UPI0021BB5DBE|nr:CBM35 domain-containing protein [Paenibacillus andongensis]
MFKKYKLIAYAIITALLLQVFALSPAVVYAADYTIGTDENFTYKLVQDTGLNGYKLEIYNGASVVWSSPNGPVGIRTVDANNAVSDFQYKAYSTLAVNGSEYVGTASFTTSNGSTINVEDRYTYVGGKINISRRSTVASANQNDKGFMTTLVVRSSDAKQPADYKWFAPSMWYGNDSDNFTDRSRAAFKGFESSLAVDALSVPLISNYDASTGLSLSVADATNGKMETVDGDMNVNSKILIDDRINVAGLGLRKVTSGTSNYTEMFQTFPGYTRDWQGAFGDNQVIWRFSPMTANSIKNSDIRLSLKSYADFSTSIKTRWRDAYGNVTDNYRSDVQSVFEELVAYIDRGFGYVGSAAKYMANSTIATEDSGFIGRAADLASIMLWAGNYYGHSEYLDHARAVINYQISSNKVGAGYMPDRSYAEALQNILKAYIVDKNKNGVTNTSWYNYVISKVDSLWISPTGTYYNDRFGIPLLMEVYNYTHDVKYLNQAIAIGDAQWNGGWNTLRFNNGVVDYGPSGVCFDREMAGKALESFMALYRATSDSKWLDRAKTTADYLETWQIRENFQMTPFSTNQYETDQIAKPYGLSFVNAGSASIDQYMINWVPEFTKLYQATGDSHYKDFANDVLYNSLEYVNMNDRIGALGDTQRDTGIGFTLEVMWSSVDRERTWWNRGKGHVDNVPWVPYTIMTGIQQLKDLTGFWGLDATTYPTQVVKYEAENAALSGGAAIATDRTGRTGAAHVGGYGSQGATTTFTVNVPQAGNYRAVIRYGAASGDKRNSLYVNGNKLGVLTFPNTANWDTWADRPVDLSLNSGSNTIAIKYDTGDSGNINLDNLIVIPLDQKYEAEDEATLIGQSAVTNGSGNYSGTGFVGWTQTPGAGIRFAFNVTNDGNYTLKTRYGAGDANKTMSLYINGVKTKQVAFNKTANWNTWADENEIVYLKSGLNMVEYKYDSGDTGNINLDYIVVSPYAKRLEAEYDAARGGNVTKDHVGSGFSGGAYLKVPAQQGNMVSFNTTVPATTYEKLSLIYSAGAGTVTASLYVDGTKLKQISLNGTTNSNAYALREDFVNLTAGFHSIDYKIDSGDSGNFNIDYLQLGEVKQLPIPSGTNAVLNKTAAANAFFTAGRGVIDQDPALAVDGTTANGKWCTNVDYGAQWLQVDIGQPVDLNRWVVKHAGAGGESATLNTKDFKLQGSMDGSTWFDVDTVTGNTASVTDRTVSKFTARYVRLYITTPTQNTDQHSRIYEFEVYTSTVTTVKVDDKNAAVTYNPAWGNWNDVNDYNGSESSTNTVNSYAQFTFTGTSIKYIGQTQPNYGKLDVYIDNVLDAADIDLYAPVTTKQAVIYTKTGLTNAQHTIKIVAKGTKNAASSNTYIGVDAFEYTTQ